jgi:effector-binding domain-containing protein
MKKSLLFQTHLTVFLPLMLMISITSMRHDSLFTGDAYSLKQDTVKIILEKTRFNDMHILYITDTAQATKDISDVLGKDYGELMQYIEKSKLPAKNFMAWYYTTQPPWQMDIAVETDKLPRVLKTGRIKSRVQPGGEVLIAHMWGPYDQADKAYGQIENWLKENNRLAKGMPFEVYINDPAAVKSPSEIQTDIYQPLQVK